AHHAQADRAFRWAQAMLFLVTPEKYQMTELVPYYRLASRYRLPSLLVMNKAEEQAAVDDFAQQAGARGEGQGARIARPAPRALQRRLQQRSVLYLMGPGKMLDRVRQVPALLARLPRTTWDFLRHGQLSGGNDQGGFPNSDWDRGVPDFRAALQDQFAVVQS